MQNEHVAGGVGDGRASENGEDDEQQPAQAETDPVTRPAKKRDTTASSHDPVTRPAVAERDAVRGEASDGTTRSGTGGRPSAERLSAERDAGQGTDLSATAESAGCYVGCRAGRGGEAGRTGSGSVLWGADTGWHDMRIKLSFV